MARPRLGLLAIGFGSFDQAVKLCAGSGAFGRGVAAGPVQLDLLVGALQWNALRVAMRLLESRSPWSVFAGLLVVNLLEST